MIELTLVTVTTLFLVGNAPLDFEVRWRLAVVVLTVGSGFGQRQVTAGAGVTGFQLRHNQQEHNYIPHYYIAGDVY